MELYEVYVQFKRVSIAKHLFRALRGFMQSFRRICGGLNAGTLVCKWHRRTMAAII